MFPGGELDQGGCWLESEGCMASALSPRSWVLERKEIPREVLQGAEHSERSVVVFFFSFNSEKARVLDGIKAQRKTLKSRWKETGNVQSNSERMNESRSS